MKDEQFLSMFERLQSPVLRLLSLVEDAHRKLLFERHGRKLLGEPGHALGRQPRVLTLALSAIAAAGSAQGTQIDIGGEVLALSASSDAASKLEVCFDDQPATGNWFPLAPCGKVRKPDGTPFVSFRVRLQTGTPSSATRNAIFLIDPTNDRENFSDPGRYGNVSATGNTQAQFVAQNLAGADVNVVASDEGALASAGWTGAAYVRAQASAAGRWLVNLITAQDGITGGSGVVAANTPRVVLATDVPLPTGANTIGAVNQGTAAAIAGGWPAKVTDGTNGPATVKPASTAAVAGDLPLVVAHHPSSPTPAGTNEIGIAQQSAVAVPLATDTVQQITPKVSNGTTAVALVAAVAAKRTFPLLLVIANEDATTDFQVLILDGATTILEIQAPHNSTFALDAERSLVVTTANTALNFKLNAAGANVKVSGTAITKT